MKKLTFLFLFLSVSWCSFSQSYFQDGLSAEWHRSRRDALRELMPANSAAVIFNNPVKNRSNDVDFIYHPNTDFYWRAQNRVVICCDMLRYSRDLLVGICVPSGVAAL